MVEHRGLLAVSAAWENLYALRPGLRHLQMAGFSFDVFSADLIRALCFGGELVLCPRQVLMDPPALYRLLDEAQIDFADFVPAVLNPLLAWAEETGHGLSFLDTVVCGSDTWSAHGARQLRALCGEAVRIVHAYGVTEASIDSTCFEFPAQPAPDASLPIGRPLANTRVYLLDALGAPVPTGVAGELHIGGVGVARGYLNQPQLNAERFIDNPFVAGDRLYRTGDLARCRADGNPTATWSSSAVTTPRPNCGGCGWNWAKSKHAWSTSPGFVTRWCCYAAMQTHRPGWLPTTLKPRPESPALASCANSWR